MSARGASQSNDCPDGPGAAGLSVPASKRTRALVCVHRSDPKESDIVEAEADPSKPLDAETEASRRYAPAPLALDARIEIILMPPCIAVEQSRVRSITRAPELDGVLGCTPEVHVSEGVAA